MGVIARQSIKGAIANYIGVAIGFFTTFFILTRYLQPEEIGLTRVMVDIAMLFSSLAQLGSNATVVKYFPYFRDGRNNHGIFGWSLLLPLLGFSIFAIAFLLFRNSLLDIYSDQSPLLADYLYLLPMLTFFALYTSVFENNASVLMRIAVPKLVREVGIRLMNLVVYILYGLHLISLDLFVWLFCAAYGIAMLLNLAYLFHLGHISLRIERGFPDRAHRREILQYSLFMTATVLAGNIPLVNTLFLGAKTGLASAGIYAISSYIANVVEIPYRSLGAVSKPVIASAVKDGNWVEAARLGKQVSLHQFMVSSTIFFVIWINISTLFAIIPNGAEYAAGTGVVLMLGIAKITNSSLSIGTDMLNFSRHYPMGLLFIAILTISAIGLNSPLIGLLGITGAATATFLSYIIYFSLLLAYLAYRQHVNIFSSAQLRMLLLMLILFAINAAWQQWLSPLLPLLLDLLLKNLILLSLTLFAILRLHISDQVNAIATRIICKLLKTNKDS